VRITRVTHSSLGPSPAGAAAAAAAAASHDAGAGAEEGAAAASGKCGWSAMGAAGAGMGTTRSGGGGLGDETSSRRHPWTRWPSGGTMAGGPISGSGGGNWRRGGVHKRKKKESKEKGRWASGAVHRQLVPASFLTLPFFVSSLIVHAKSCVYMDSHVHHHPPCFHIPHKRGSMPVFSCFLTQTVLHPINKFSERSNQFKSIQNCEAS
jgi:hypothetical protein